MLLTIQESKSTFEKKVDLNELKRLYFNSYDENYVELFRDSVEENWDREYNALFNDGVFTLVLRQVIKTYLFEIYLEHVLSKDIEDRRKYELLLDAIKSKRKLLSSRTVFISCTNEDSLEEYNWKEIIFLICSDQAHMAVQFMQVRAKLGTAIEGVDYISPPEFK